MVSDLISSWPLINSDRVNSSFAIAAVIVLTYDWALTFGQEIELIWRQRWSLMAVLYLSVRYLGIQYSIPLLDTISWILVTVWEVLALCLAVWVAIKHFEEFRQHSAGGIIGDCFRVLIETHMFYFASFAMVSSLNLIHFLSSNSSDQFSPGVQMYEGFLQVFPVVKLFVLGPRLILSVREYQYHAKLVTDSDAVTGMTSIGFQERMHISTGNGV